jgi:phosphoglycolate phosphatase-like HAD superfamily hydrolase
MFRLIILDFDGVILESVSVKTAAFRTLFSTEPDHVDEIVEFHINNGGMSRYDKFRYIYHHILKKELDPATFDRLSETFSDLVFQAVIDVPFVPGASEFLEHYGREIPLYIVSATPEKELKEIVRARNLTRYFRNVYGAPRKKAECIQEILLGSGSQAPEVLFVGDALNDLAAAQSSGVKFIGRVGVGEKNIFRNCTGVETVITDLYDLAAYLERRP